LVDVVTSSRRLLALYTKRRTGSCLTHVGREGGPDFQHRTVHLPDLSAYAAIIRGVDRGSGTGTAQGS
jgi:hypothetical protein